MRKQYPLETSAISRLPLEKGYGQAKLFLPNDIPVVINNAIYAPDASRSLISLRDLINNGLNYSGHTDSTTNKHVMILQENNGNKQVKCEMQSNGLFAIDVRPQHCVNANHNNCDPTIWHSRLGHPGKSTQRRLSTAVLGLPNNFISSLNLIDNCSVCAVTKLSIKPALPKFDTLPFLHLLHVDVCGPISPNSGPFKYFMVIIDSSSRYFHIALLKSRNDVYPKLLVLIIKLRNQFPDFTIKRIRFDNAAEFSSSSLLESYLSSIGIEIEFSVSYAHNQNGMAEALIKRLQLILRSILFESNLPLSSWSHAVLHAGQLLRIRPTLTHSHSPHQLMTGNIPNVSHLRRFGCLVYVPISPVTRSKIGPQRQPAIYVGFDSPSIIRYISILTGDLFRASFKDCVFNESVFPTLGGESTLERTKDDLKFTSNQQDPVTDAGNGEIKKILDLQRIAEEAPDNFAEHQRITKPGQLLLNTPARVQIDDGTPKEIIQRKRGRPPGSADKRKRVRPSNRILSAIDEEENDEHVSGQEANDVTYISYHTAMKIIDDDPDPTNLEEARRSPKWTLWLEAMESELKSLEERRVFGPIEECPESVKTVGCRWVFSRKRDGLGKVIKYKARLVAQGFTQRYGIDYYDTYSPVLDMNSFRYLISFTVCYSLKICLMDVVTAYLYGDIDTDIYMNIPEGLKVTSATPFRKPVIKRMRALYGLKQSGRLWYQNLSVFLVERGFVNSDICPCVFIKHALNDFVILAVYVDDINVIGTTAAVDSACKTLDERYKMKYVGDTALCLGLKIDHLRQGIFVHQTQYVRKLLKRFGMDKANPCRTPLVVRTLDPPCKDEYRPCSDPQEKKGRESGSERVGESESTPPRALTRCPPLGARSVAAPSDVPESIIDSRALTRGHPMLEEHGTRSVAAPSGASDDVDTVCKEGEKEEVLSSNYPYREAIGALNYLANSTRPDISFAVNLLARHSLKPTKRHWNGIKQIMRYLRGTEDYGLLYSKEKAKEDLIGYADAGYLSDPHSGRSQNGYVFTCGGTAISWRSTKQTMVATSSNHAELIALYEASRECYSLRSLQQHIRTSCGMSPLTKPMIIYEDNAACIHQLSQGYLRSDRTKHISPKTILSKGIIR